MTGLRRKTQMGQMNADERRWQRAFLFGAEVQT
jgi:hypothetical protein